MAMTMFMTMTMIVVMLMVASATTMCITTISHIFALLLFSVCKGMGKVMQLGCKVYLLYRNNHFL